MLKNDYIAISSQLKEAITVFVLKY